MSNETLVLLNAILKKVEAIEELLISKFPEPIEPVKHYAQITFIERGETRNSGQPKWTCTCHDGSRLWIIQHSDPLRDSTGIWRKHGFVWAMLESMGYGDNIDCAANPLEVELQKEGDFWKVIGILRNPFDLWQVTIQTYDPFPSHDEDGALST